MSRGRIAGTAAASQVSAQVRLQLRDSIESISKAAGIREDLVGKHLDRVVVRALERLRDRYVTEMGAAVERVGQLREVVHRYYEKAFRKQLRAEEMAELRTALDRLRDTSRELVPPDVWALRQQQRQGLTVAEPEPVPAGRDSFDGVDDFDVNAHRPAGEPIVQPALGALPRWAVRRTAQRIEALPEPSRSILLRARGLRRSVVDEALTGGHAAEFRMVDELRALFPEHELNQLMEAVGGVKTTDVPYALGGGMQGRGLDPGVQAAYRALPLAERTALDHAAHADPEFVRAMVLGEERPGMAQNVPVPWRPEEMDQFSAAAKGFDPAKRVDLERALIAVNRAHESRRRAMEAGVGDTPDARSRAVQLDRQVAALGLPSTGQVAEALRASALLRDLGTRNPDRLLRMAELWLRKAERDRADGKEILPLETYVRDVIMATHERGMVGEFAAVFQLGKDVLVMKAPGTDVTVGGTDFIVVLRDTGEIWLCDNKTLSSAGLGEVSSLVENIGKNLDKDVAELSRSLAGLDPTLAGVPEIMRALDRLRAANTEVGQVLARVAQERGVAKLTPEQVSAPEVQARIAAILGRGDPGIRRVITNAGGELTYLQKRLTDMKIDFADLRSRFADILAAMRRGGTSGGGGTP